MSQAPIDWRLPRWEWRTFAPECHRVDALTPAEYEIAHDVYLLRAGSNTNVKIRNERIEVKTLEKADRGLELWRPVFSAAFPLCQREVRDVLRHFPVRLPSLFLPQYSVLEFVADIAAGADLRIAAVHKTRRHAIVEGCIVERAAASAGGKTVQTAAIEGADPDSVRRLLSRLRLDELENVGYVTYLKRLLGMNPTAPAPGEVKLAIID